MTNNFSITKFKLTTRVSGASVFPFIRDGVTFTYLIVMLTANIGYLATRGVLTAEEVAKQGSIISQATAVLFFGLSIFMQIVDRKSVRRILVTAAPLVPMLIWVLLSVTWSDFPDASIRRALRLVVDTTTAILLAAGYRDQYRFLRVIYFTFTIILIADIALLGVPSLSFTPIGYAGVHESKQAAGIFCLVALPLFLLAAIDRRIFPFRIISFSAVLGCLIILAISLSKSALGLVPICVILTLAINFIRRTKSLTAFVMILILAIVALIAILIIVSIGFDEILKVTVGDPTLTGRDQIWDYSLSLFSQSPLLGHGYGAVWNVGVFSVLQLPEMSESFVLTGGQNGYLDVMAESGIVGLSLAMIFLASVLYRLLVRMPHEEFKEINLIAIYTFFAITLEDMFETNIFRSGAGFWIYFLLITHAAMFVARAPDVGSNGRG